MPFGTELEIVSDGAGIDSGFASCSKRTMFLFPLLLQPVRDFYERTSEFDMDAWSQWCGPFRAVRTSALGLLFSRRLQQLNVPLSPLDAAKGIASSVVQMREPQSGSNLQTAWVQSVARYRQCSLCRLLFRLRYAGASEPMCESCLSSAERERPRIMKAEAHRWLPFRSFPIGRAFGDARLLLRRAFGRRNDLRAIRA